MSEEGKAYKVVLIGESGVGKTCIINQFIYNKFDTETMSSLTAQFAKKIIEFSDNKRINFHIWDTAGQEKYRTLAQIFYKDADAVILVYDVTSQKSFDELKNYWYGQISRIEKKDVVIAVAANKSDLYEERQVSNEEGEKFAFEKNAIFGLTSAKADTGITGLFDNIGRKILDPTFDFAANEKKMREEFERQKRIEKKKEENKSYNAYAHKAKKNKNSKKSTKQPVQNNSFFGFNFDNCC